MVKADRKGGTMPDTPTTTPEKMVWWRKLSINLRSIGSNGSQSGKRFMPKQTLKEEFATDVVKASKLLAFLMSEGHPYHLTDEIIEQIRSARALIDTNTSLSPDNYTQLTKAYRDLITISQTSVTFDGVPPAPFWGMDSWWLRSFVLVTIVPLVVFFSFLFFEANVLSTPNGPPLSKIFFHLLEKNRYSPIIYLVSSIFIFWALYVFTGVVTNSKLNHIIRFCYIFTVIAIILSILPFCSPTFFSRLSVKAPLGVLQGCASTGKPSTTPNSSIPGEVLCSEENYQWVINIGGLVVSSPKTAGMEHYEIRGGLVVPLYVIVLALLGSAVSMTRRVPEYQRRAMDAQEALTNVKAREDLVFQIMQVVSAPLIAITVYYILKPSTPTESAVLGFGSGFASEPILLMIRSLVEKLSPAETAKQTPVSIRVDPPSVVLAPGETKQFAARVLGSSNSDVSWSIDPPDVSSGTISQSGYYASPSVDPGKTITITARSVADPTKSGNASIIFKAKHPDKQASATVRVNPSSARD